MKLGAGTYAWSAYGCGLAVAIQEIASLGIKYVDVLGAGHGEPANFTDTQKRDIRKLMDDLGVRTSSVLALYEGNIASGEPEEMTLILDYMKEILDFCQILGADQILYKPGDKIITLPHEYTWANSVAFSRTMSDLARHYNVFITFELVPRPFALVQTIADVNRMLDDVGRDNVLTNLDLGHIALTRDGVDDIATVARRTIHLHLNDNDTYVHTNDVVGTGDVPLEDYIRALVAHGAEDTCRELGVELVAGIEIEVEEKDKGTLTPLTITRQSRDYILEHLEHITL